MSQRKANILQFKTNINNNINPSQLINTNNDDLIAIEQKNINKIDNSLSKDNQTHVPLIKDNSINTDINNINQQQQGQSQSLIMGNPYGGGIGLYGGGIGGYGGLYNGLGGYGGNSFGGFGMNIPGRTDTFFDKLFMTVERANYQMFHLCEMIKMIQHQTPTIKYFYQLLTEAYYYFLAKSKEAYQKAKNTLCLLSQIISIRPHEQSESLIKEIKVLDFLVKSILITCLSGIVIKLYSK